MYETSRCFVIHRTIRKDIMKIRKKESRELVGKKFLMLTAKEIVMKGRHVYYKCSCDCGKETTIRWTSLGKTKSCGCLRIRKMKYAQLIGANKRKLDTDQKAFSKILSTYKSGAKRRNFNFELTNVEFKELIESNCHYCNRHPSNTEKTIVNKEYKLYEEKVYNGIDRIDSSIGYVKENCVTACYLCNKLKMDLSYSDFLNLVKNIYEFKKLNDLQCTKDLSANLYIEQLERILG